MKNKGLNSVINSLKENENKINATKETPKAEETKKETPKEDLSSLQSTLSAIATEMPKTKKTKKAKNTAKVKETKKAKTNKVIKEVKDQQKASLVEEVVAHREVKYIYPEDVQDTLARKTWRQKTRNKLHRLELDLARIKDQNSKEYKAKAKEYQEFKASVLKPEQVA